LLLPKIRRTVLVSACSTTTAPVAKKQVDVTMVTHLAAALPEQDVYAEIPAGSGQVQRVTVDNYEEHLTRPVYAAQSTVEHDLFQLGLNPLGPYTKGADLDFTMKSWLAATGTGTYTVNGDEARIDLSFENLVPNGLYTLWCAEVTVPPNVNILDKPCGAADGSENIFTADEDGHAEVQLDTRALPASTEETSQVLAIAYHSDGQTYGPIPGAFGLNTHVQIFYMIPGPDDAAWQHVSKDDLVAER
jgi:hypothetical protein